MFLPVQIGLPGGSLIMHKVEENGYIIAITTAWVGAELTESEHAAIRQRIQNKPTDPDGYTYKLRADNLEWELVELPPAPEYEPTVEDKAEAYDILMGEEGTE